MKKMLLMFGAVSMMLPAVAGNISELADSSRVYDLDEVVVVAQSKDFYKLRQQPMSASVLTSNEMNKWGIYDLRDASAFVPSFVMPAYGSRYTSSMYVRGIGSRINSPSMGVYVDNMPLMSKSAFNTHFYGLDRVDVLRGPQGTLYGINSEGGLVRIFTKNPMNYQGTDLRVSVGTHFHRTVEAAHYHKFSDQLALSLAGFYNGTNGFFRNEFNQERADKMDEAGGRLRLVAKPSTRLTFDLMADYQFVRQNGFPYGLLDADRKYAAHPNTNRQGNYKRNMLNTGLNVNYAADWTDLIYTASWQYLNDDMLMDIDYRPLDFMHMQDKQLQSTITQELMLKSHQLGIWQGTTGLFFSHQWLKTDAPVFFDTDMNKFLSKTIEDYAYYGMLNSMAKRMGMEAAKAMIERAGGCHITMDTETIPGLFRTPQTNYGLFHESNILLTDRLKATLGFRYDITRNKIDYATSAITHLDENVMGVNVKATVRSVLEHQEDATFNQFLPKIGLTYRIDNSGSNVYALVSKGYRAGGFNIQMFSDILQSELQSQAQSVRGDMEIAHDEQSYDNIRNTIQYRPEESWNYEVGTHLNLFDNVLHLDLSAYYMQIRNQQLSVFATQYGFGRSMVNAGKSYSCGVEATLRGSAFDDHLNWGISYGYTRAKFKEYMDSVSIDGKTSPIDYSGKYVPFVPQHTLAANADYRFDVDSPVLHSLTVGVNMNAQGKTYWDSANSYDQRFYMLLGAHIDADLSPVTVSVWGRNLTNNNYNTFAIDSNFGGEKLYFAQRGNPFQIGVDIKLHF
jgi:outer membrane receptor protein involved in Fe transport